MQLNLSAGQNVRQHFVTAARIDPHVKHTGVVILEGGWVGCGSGGAGGDFHSTAINTSESSSAK